MIDERLSRRILIYAALGGATGVLLGAFGAHGLEGFLAEGISDRAELSKRLQQYDVAVRYHLIHSVALFSLASVPFGSPLARRWVARLFTAGILLFSGSLYAIVFSGYSKLGMVTPVGGLCWIAAWLGLLAVARPTR